MPQMDAGGKSNVVTKLLPIALWWFRWGAMWTFVTGLLMLAMRGHFAGPSVYSSGWGVAIIIGAVLGITMWANVWFIIWPKQQIVMASANQVAAGGAALPEAAIAAPKALLASRTNTLFSIPMLYFMLAAGHMPVPVTPDTNLTAIYIVLGLLLLAIEGNAIKGKLGPLQTVKGVISSGFGLTLLIYIIIGLFV